MQNKYFLMNGNSCNNLIYSFSAAVELMCSVLSIVRPATGLVFACFVQDSIDLAKAKYVENASKTTIKSVVKKSYSQ